MPKKTAKDHSTHLAKAVIGALDTITKTQEEENDANDTRDIEGVLTFDEVDPDGELLIAALEYQSITSQISALESKQKKLKRLVRLMMNKDDFETLPEELYDDTTKARLKWYPHEMETIQDHLLLAQGVSPEIIRNATKRTESRYFRVFLPKPKKLSSKRDR